jgi:glucosamine-6-phosphate deaminase
MAVPQMAITMGIATIMEAKQCLLLACGTSKSQAIAKAIEGPITSMVPASILQMHPNTVAIIDEAASSMLNEVEYYNRSYANLLSLQ